MKEWEREKERKKTSINYQKSLLLSPQELQAPSELKRLTLYALE